MGKTVKVITLSSVGKKRRKEGGKGSKKYGRNLAHCARYKNENRREKNKVRKARKLEKFMAKKALKKLNRA